MSDTGALSDAPANTTDQDTTTNTTVDTNQTTEADTDFTQPDTDFTQPDTNFTQPDTNFTQPDTNFTQPDTADTTDADAIDVSPLCESPEGFGCECIFDSDCTSDVCLDFGFQFSICSQTCATDADCAYEGFECGLAEDFLDVIRICVPKDPDRCVTCDDDTDCAEGYICRDIGGEQACVFACDWDADCFPGTTCEQVSANFSDEGCVPVTGSCLDCYDGDGDGFGVGSECATAQDCNDDFFSINPGTTERCNGYDDNCVDGIDEGFDLNSDVNNCGECGNSCNTAHTTSATCDAGQCEILQCESGFEDCDTIPDSGCEEDLNGPTLCGTCGPYAGVPGQACGTCNSGLWACNGTGAVACSGDLGNAALNACGGCGTLPGDIDDPCGTCDSGTFACSGVSLVCTGDAGDAARNACGGCGALPETVGGACGGTCGNGVWTCDGQENVVCVGDGLNDCGGCGALPGVPGAACGTCNFGTWACDGSGSTLCEDADICDPDLSVGNGETVSVSGSQTYDRLDIGAGGVLAIEGFDGTTGDPSSGTAGYGTVTITARSIYVRAGGRIDATGKGGAGTSPGQSITDALENDSGAGGGYGGRGANGATNILQGGVAFGTATGPDISQGSNGGETRCRFTCAPCNADTPRPQGGKGGGIITLIADEIIIEGEVISNGAPGDAGGNVQLGGGGGSGGAIWIEGTDVSITGLVIADGGSGGAGTGTGTCIGFGGSGGGGGRIKVNATNFSGGGTLRAAGGVGAFGPGATGRTGSPGTVDLP